MLLAHTPVLTPELVGMLTYDQRLGAAATQAGIKAYSPA